MTKTSPFKHLHGKTVLVTGASAGIGRALAVTLVRAGARVGLLARRAERLRELERELGADAQVLSLVADVTDDVACRRAVDALGEAFGGIDLVINNAGVSMNGRFADTELSVFRTMMDVNYFGSLHIAKFALPWLEKSRGGLVFVSSIVGKRGFPTRSGYAASKFAVHGLFESLRVEWAAKGITVSLVAPGYTETEIRRAALGPDGHPRGGEGMTRGDVMAAEDAAAAILDAAQRRRREVILTGGGRAMVWLNKLLPHVADRLAAKVIG